SSKAGPRRFRPSPEPAVHEPFPGNRRVPVNRWARARIARWVDRRLNATHVPPPYRASEEARRLHETLFVADLHADTLLWARDLLARSEQGHLDLPRLVEGGGTLQAFTVVTYVPRSR